MSTSLTCSRSSTASGREAKDHQVMTKPLALYHNNLGAELIVSGKAWRSRWIRYSSLFFSGKDHSDAWNNLGAAYRRLGKIPTGGVELQKRALRYDRYNYSALANLTQFYLSTNRQVEAEQYLQRVNRYYQRNPYFHYYMARLHFTSAATIEDARAFLVQGYRIEAG